jgi:predicted nucleic acid-binding protein
MIDTDAESPEVLLLDTSTAVALILEDHEAHEAVLNAVHGYQLGLAGHAWFETYSVLTRLPSGLRRSPSDAFRLLAHNFPATMFLGEMATSGLVGELATLGISGAAVCDALVGAAAREHGRQLATRDARARPVYETLGVQTHAAS